MVFGHASQAKDTYIVVLLRLLDIRPLKWKAQFHLQLEVMAKQCNGQTNNIHTCRTTLPHSLHYDIVTEYNNIFIFRFNWINISPSICWRACDSASVLVAIAKLKIHIQHSVHTNATWWQSRGTECVFCLHSTGNAFEVCWNCGEHSASTRLEWACAFVCLCCRARVLCLLHLCA